MFDSPYIRIDVYYSHVTEGYWNKGYYNKNDNMIYYETSDGFIMDFKNV
jgi:hypothetical protein